MIRIAKEHLIFNMVKGMKPAAYAETGETVVFETVDCFNNQITTEEMGHDSLHGDYANPATGPLYVNGAEPGDILKIHVIDVKVAEYGIMTATEENSILHGKLSGERTKKIYIKDGYGEFNEKLRLPIFPMIGVIGVAPEKNEGILTVDPGAHGGNMDCGRIVAGSTLYLPVNVEGALLSMGDLHAIMGDGETGGCGLEVAGEVTIKVEILKGKKYPLPLLIEGGRIMTIASEKTMDDANKQAVRMMHELLVNELKMDAHEAGFLLSLAGDLRPCQIVDSLMTARMELPLDILEKYDIHMR